MDLLNWFEDLINLSEISMQGQLNVNFDSG